MAKFCGKVGYLTTVESVPGVWSETIVERTYFGNINRNSSRWEDDKDINDNININNEISILADPYAYQHFSEIKYVVFMGVKWKVKNLSVERPRLILTLGGIYNGQ